MVEGPAALLLCSWGSELLIRHPGQVVVEHHLFGRLNLLQQRGRRRWLVPERVHDLAPFPYDQSWVL